MFIDYLSFSSFFLCSMLCLLIILSCCGGAKRVLVRAFAGDEARPSVEVALHDILLVVPIVCVCPTAWGIGNLFLRAFNGVSSAVIVLADMSNGITY